MWPNWTIEQWTIAAACGQIAAALISAIALVFVGKQIQLARASTNIQAISQFLKDAAERERELFTDSPERKDQAFNEFLNFLEVSSAIVNDTLLSGRCHSIVLEKVRDSVVILSESPAWHEKLSAAVTSPTTFSELRTFMRRDKKNIDALLKSRAMQRRVEIQSLQ